MLDNIFKFQIIVILGTCVGLALVAIAALLNNDSIEFDVFLKMAVFSFIYLNIAWLIAKKLS